MFTVTISEKGGQQKQYDFSKPEITIGRMKGNDIVLPKGNVSKQHTRIFMRDDKFYIVDLKSTNGTYVNGRKVTTEQSIGESDKIYIGDFILQLERQSAQQGGGPPRPPRPPENAPAGGDGAGGGPPKGGGGGRQFPTVMEGARSGGPSPQQQSQSGGSPQPTRQSPRVQPPGGGGPQRTTSGAGASLGAEPNQSSPGNALSSDAPDPGADDGEDLRKTYGESSPPVDFTPEIEPLDSGDDSPPQPSTSSPGASPGPSGSTPGPSGSTPGPSGSTPGPTGSSSGRSSSSPGPSGSSPSLSGSSSGRSSSSPGPSGSSPSLSGSSAGPVGSGSTPSPPGDSSAPPPSAGPPSGRPSSPAPSPSSGGADAPGDLAAGAGAPGALGASALVADEPLNDEFDQEFHRAQQDAARVFFDSMPVVELPLDYPLDDGAVEQQVDRSAKDAIKAVGASVDDQALLDTLTKEAVGLGPLEDYLDDDDVQSIYVNAYDRIVVRRDGELVIAERAYSHPDMLDLAARRLLGPHETPPVSDEVRFADGTRVHILMPPVAVEGPVLTVQKPNRHFPTLEQLQQQDALSAGMVTFLQRVVEAGRSILIAGPISSGKSTVLAALTDTIPSASRVVAVEQHSNLPVDEPNFICLEASPGSGIDMSFLVENAVAMHPERIILDECRGAEGYDWVTTATAGTQGSMMTLNATSAVDALARLESMCLLGASEVSPRGLREQIARAVDLVVVVNSTSERGFRVQQIAEVQGVDIDAFRLNDIFYYRVEGTAGDFHPTGYIPLFYEDLRHAGFDVDLSIFRE